MSTTNDACIQSMDILAEPDNRTFDDWTDTSPNDYAECGVGPVLNPDWESRDAILGIYTRKDPDDLTPFQGLDVARLEMLLAENFLSLDSTFDEEPALQTLLEFMRRWPWARVSGYAVHPKRKDYRITIDAIRCDMDTVPHECRARLRKDFAETFARATELEMWRDAVVACWI